MREAGDVCFADVYKDGTGVCEYVRYEDMKYALKKLDDSKFRSHEVGFFQDFFKMKNVWLFIFFSGRILLRPSQRRFRPRFKIAIEVS